VSTALPKGLFISFEGIDGAGKSSHIEALAQAFRDQGRVVTLTREPGGTPLAEKLRALMLHDAMDPLTEALIAFAARRDHLVQVIEPALARGEVVISDRFTDATLPTRARAAASAGSSCRFWSAWRRPVLRCRQVRTRISCASPT
jgi:dTMP kinase